MWPEHLSHFWRLHRFWLHPLSLKSVWKMITSIKVEVEMLWTLRDRHNCTSGWQRQGVLQAYVGTAALCKNSVSVGHRAPWCRFAKKQHTDISRMQASFPSRPYVSHFCRQREGGGMNVCVCVWGGWGGVAMDAAEHRGAVVGGWITEQHSVPAYHPYSVFFTRSPQSVTNLDTFVCVHF